MIPGVILAAGRSERMGRPKALLPCGPGGETFVRRLALALTAGGVDGVFVVGRPADAALEAEVAVIPVGLTYVENIRAGEGQLSSVLAGLATVDAPGVIGVLVTPVDAPMIHATTIASLLSAFRSGGAPVVRPVYRGKHGHPVIFARTVFDELRQADPAVGARSVVRAHAGQVLDVDVGDPGVLGDVDTPADYRALRAREL